MQIIKHKTNIDFIGKRKPAIFVSTALNLIILVGIAVWGFNFGVDFAGGTVVEVKFDHPVSAAEVRKRAESGDLRDVSVQSIGASGENSFLLRLGGVTQLTDVAQVILFAIEQPLEDGLQIRHRFGEFPRGETGAQDDAAERIGQIARHAVHQGWHCRRCVQC